MGEIAINPTHNVFKKYKQVIYVNPYLMTAPAPVVVENTFIGGVAATLYTAQLLATKLAIDVSRITAFSVLGSDIKCKITGSYALPSNAFLASAEITYYTDFDSLMSEIGNNGFYQCLNLLNYKLEAVMSVGIYAFQYSNAKNHELKNAVTILSNAFEVSTSKIFYIPRCINLGGSVGDNGVFAGTGAGTGKIVYAHPSLQTNNAGGEDGDIAVARVSGMTIKYVTSFVAPNAVTTLSVGSIYNTAVQLNFTPPTGNTNAIEFYECYANGVFKNTIKASGEYISGLNASTFYNITVLAVDVFYNKSEISNTVNVSTVSNSSYLLNGLTAYYNLNANSVDSKNAINGTDSTISYVAAKIGNGAAFNGTSSRISIPNNTVFNSSNGTIQNKMTIAFWIKLNQARTQMVMCKRAAAGYEWQIILTAADLQYEINTPAGVYNSIISGTPIPLNTWTHITIVNDGSRTISGNRFFVNGILKSSTANTVVKSVTAVTTSPLVLGRFEAGGSLYLDGVLDDVTFWDRILSDADALENYNRTASLI